MAAVRRDTPRAFFAEAESVSFAARPSLTAWKWETTSK
jgi:hypothetical protein